MRMCDGKKEKLSILVCSPVAKQCSVQERSLSKIQSPVKHYFAFLEKKLFVSFYTCM
jgi:hypothetical protein